MRLNKEIQKENELQRQKELQREQELQKEKEQQKEKEKEVRKKDNDFGGTFAKQVASKQSSAQVSNTSNKKLGLVKEDTGNFSRDDLSRSKDNSVSKSPRLPPLRSPKLPPTIIPPDLVMEKQDTVFDPPKQLLKFPINDEVKTPSMNPEHSKDFVVETRPTIANMKKNEMLDKDESPVEHQSPFEGMGSPLDDISPIENDLSVSNKDINHVNFKEEVEVPLDFGEYKKSPKETGEDDASSTTSKQLNIVVNENALYWPTHFLCDEIYNYEQEYQDYKAYQIMALSRQPQDYLIVGCEMVKDQGVFSLKLFWYKPQDERNYEEYIVPVEEIKVVLKLITAKDVVPHSEPVKLVRDFKKYIHRFIFSFCIYNNDEKSDKKAPSLQIKCTTRGLFKDEIQVKFLNKKDCVLIIRHLEGMDFRLTFYIKSVEYNKYSRGLSIDLKCDQSYYQKYFREIDIDSISSHIEDLCKDKFVKSFELIDQSIVLSLREEIKALENYAKNHHSSSLNAFCYGEERTNLINQIRTVPKESVPGEESDTGKPGEDKEYKELWVVRDDPDQRAWIYSCKTLYKLPISQTRHEQIERDYTFTYDNLEEYFGVDINSLDRSDVKMFASMILDSMKLKMPTMNMKRTSNEDPDAEEEIYITIQGIETICNVRHIVDIDNRKLPLTMSLLGDGTRYLGIKAVTYDRDKFKESGVFFRVYTDEWKYNDDYIAALARHKKKDPLKHFYELPNLLVERGGFRHIFEKLIMGELPTTETKSNIDDGNNSSRTPFIENKLGNITRVDVLTKKDFELFLGDSP